MKKILAIALTAVAFAAFQCVSFAEDDRADAAIMLSSAAINDLALSPDKQNPGVFLSNAVAIGIFPGMKKGGYIIGGTFGRGVIMYRGTSPVWSNPAFFSLKGGSIGLQAGIQEFDLILFFLSEESFSNFFTNFVNVGLNLSASAGPVGRDIAVNPADYKLNPEKAVYAYSRSKGLYAGLAVSGIRASYDYETSSNFYGGSYTPSQILREDEIKNPPKIVQKLKDAIQKFEQEN